MPRLARWTYIPLLQKIPCGWQPSAKTCRSSTLVMNCILSSAYVGLYIDFMKGNVELFL